MPCRVAVAVAHSAICFHSIDGGEVGFQHAILAAQILRIFNGAARQRTRTDTIGCRLSRQWLAPERG